MSVTNNCDDEDFSPKVAALVHAVNLAEISIRHCATALGGFAAEIQGKVDKTDHMMDLLKLCAKQKEALAVPDSVASRLFDSSLASLSDVVDGRNFLSHATIHEDGNGGWMALKKVRKGARLEMRSVTSSGLDDAIQQCKNSAWDLVYCTAELTEPGQTFSIPRHGDVR